MKKRVSDYIAEFMVANGITNCFMVVGGGAMHLDDSIGHNKKIKCIYNHHEQASSIAAEGYTKTNRKIAAVCVTSGPGAINALNGVIGAYQDSIPMLVLSGQTKTTLTVRKSGLKLRTLGNQEFDIVSTLDNACKFSVMIDDPKMIRYYLEKALFIATSGRPGPCWLDIPLDIQGSYIETNDLLPFDSKEYEDEESKPDSQKEIKKKVSIILDKLLKAKRPVIYAGAGVRISGSQKELLKLSRITGIPIVTCWDSIDLISSENKFYAGRAGTMGDRAGNFAVQNSDVLIAIGTRLNIYQVGYDKNTWARESFVVMNDICNNELLKPTIRVDLPVCCDCKVFINELIDAFKKKMLRFNYTEWIDQCNTWKEKYEVVRDRKEYNIYSFIDLLSRSLPENAITVVANGSASVVGSQTYHIKGKQRFIMNCGLSSMGYDLPAAIGACVANNSKEIYCIAGDGSIQMNIQELQTIITNKLPIKIIIINNDGYHQIRLTQNNLFKGRDLIGVGSDSKDLGFPDFKKIANAYGYPYYRITGMRNMKNTIERIISHPGHCICEVFVGKNYVFEPKSSTKRLPDGRLVSPPLEDLAPFLSREELESNMYIKPVGDKEE